MDIDKKEIVSFDVAKLAFRAGFDKSCFLAYNEDGELEYPNDFTGRNIFTIDDIRSAWDNEHPAYLAPYQDSLNRWLLNKYEVYPTFIFDREKETWSYNIRSTTLSFNVSYNEDIKTFSEIFNTYLEKTLNSIIRARKDDNIRVSKDIDKGHRDIT